MQTADDTRETNMPATPPLAPRTQEQMPRAIKKIRQSRLPGSVAWRESMRRARGARRRTPAPGSFVQIHDHARGVAQCVAAQEYRLTVLRVAPLLDVARDAASAARAAVATGAVCVSDLEDRVEAVVCARREIGRALRGADAQGQATQPPTLACDNVRTATRDLVQWAVNSGVCWSNMAAECEWLNVPLPPERTPSPRHGAP
jgi:hypothetical protein